MVSDSTSTHPTAENELVVSPKHPRLDNIYKQQVQHQQQVQHPQQVQHQQQVQHPQQLQQHHKEKRFDNSLDNRKVFTGGRIVYTLENCDENRNGESPDTSPQENELIQDGGEASTEGAVEIEQIPQHDQQQQEQGADSNHNKINNNKNK